MPISPLMILAVGAGGAIGALARLGVVYAVHRHYAHATHWTILWVNLAGCFALGLLAGALAGRDGVPHHLVGFVSVGVLGSFTTFSTFSVDALRLVQSGRSLEALAYIGASVVAGVGLAAAGYALTARV